MTEPLPLPVGSYALPDPRASCRRLVNCFAQAAPAAPLLGQSPSDAKQKAPPVVLTRAAGTTTFADTGLTGPQNATRGMWKMQGVLYAVIDTRLFSVGQDGTLTQVGIGISPGGFVRMTDNGACLTILIPGTAIGYNYTVAGGLIPMTQAQFLTLGAIDIGFVDTYTVFLQANGQGFYNDDGKQVSGTGPLTFNSGAQFIREFGTDLFNAMGIEHRATTMLGTDTGETYIDVGNAVGSPFSSAPDGMLQIGCAASYSVGLQDQALHFLANDKTVRRRNGQTPMRVSNHGIESILGTASLVGCYALTYSYLGHLFYALTLPAIQRTLVLDVTTGEWHELSSVATGYWRPSCAVYAYGRQFVGDSQSGKIGFLDITAETEFGDTQIVSWTHQPVYSNNARISHRRLELSMGAGFAPSYTSTPSVTLQISNDGGNTFKSMAVKSLGAKGKYKTRVAWTNLGTSRQRVYRFVLSDALVSTWVPDVMLDAAAGLY